MPYALLKMGLKLKKQHKYLYRPPKKYSFVVKSVFHDHKILTDDKKIEKIPVFDDDSVFQLHRAICFRRHPD